MQISKYAFEVTWSRFWLGLIYRKFVDQNRYYAKKKLLLKEKFHQKFPIFDTHDFYEVQSILHEAFYLPIILVFLELSMTNTDKIKVTFVFRCTQMYSINIAAIKARGI